MVLLMVSSCNSVITQYNLHISISILCKISFFFNEGHTYYICYKFDKWFDSYLNIWTR